MPTSSLVESTVKKIKSSVFDGDFVRLDAVVEGYDAQSNDPHRIELFKELCRDSFGLFSFRSAPGAGIDHALSLRDRHLRVLSLFNTNEQMSLMMFEMDHLTPEYFVHTRPTDPVSDRMRNMLAAKLLQQENFACLDVLKAWGVSCSTMLSDFYIIQRTPGSLQSSLIELTHPHPLASLVLFNATPAKLAYIQQEGVDLQQVHALKGLLEDPAVAQTVWRASLEPTFTTNAQASLALLESRIIGQQLDPSAAPSSSRRRI